MGLCTNESYFRALRKLYDDVRHLNSDLYTTRSKQLCESSVTRSASLHRCILKIPELRCSYLKCAGLGATETLQDEKAEYKSCLIVLLVTSWQALLGSCPFRPAS